MTPRNIFRVVVATLGLYGCCSGALYVIDGLLYSFGLFQLQHSEPKFYAARGGIEIVLSILVLKGLPPFVDLAFPPDEPPKEKHDETKPDA